MVMMSGFLGGVRRPVLVGALVGLVWALVAPAAGAAPPNAAKLRREADRMIAAGVPGVIVLVRDGSRTVRFARGSSRLKPHRALRVSDRFPHREPDQDLHGHRGLAARRRRQTLTRGPGRALAAGHRP